MNNLQIREEDFSLENKTDKINYKGWADFISYYRYYLDRFAEDILKLRLYPFQRLLLRAMGRSKFSMIIACRGLTKSFIGAVYGICMAILYPGIKIGICSAKFEQATKIIIAKVKGELYDGTQEYCDNIKREIRQIKTGKEDCCAYFNNGSELRAFSLNQERGGDSARGWRFQIILIDESRLIKEKIFETIIEPMTKTPRQNVTNKIFDIQESKEITDKESAYALYREEPKIVELSSAYLKSSSLYTNFNNYCNLVKNGNKNYFVTALDYNVGIDSHLWTLDDMETTKNKPNMTEDIFNYEYGAIFVGSNEGAYFPQDLIEKSRTNTTPELRQLNKTNARYILTFDVAVSGKKNSDNSVAHVIKFTPTVDGTFKKRPIYTRTLNGMPLHEQRDIIRQIVHFRFPNIEMIVIDGMTVGQGLISQFYSSWEYKNEKGEMVEYPPLIVCGDIEAKVKLPYAKEMIYDLKATASNNTDIYTYTKSQLENGNLEFLVPSIDVKDEYDDRLMIAKSEEERSEIIEEFTQFIEHDILQSELNNIKEVLGVSGRPLYTRIMPRKKRDRATSLMYGNYYISLIERDERLNDINNNEEDIDYIGRMIGFM